jgi:prevent-host-death family protein
MKLQKEPPMSEMRVGTRELKNKLSEYLRRVKAGETIIVTEHGKTIGQIIPMKESIEERMKGMIAAGQAAWNGEKLSPYKTVIHNRGKGLLSDLVIEDRE